MSFINIPDPTRRAKIVADYIKMKQRARDDDVDTRLGQLEEEKAVLTKSKPIVAGLDKVIDKLSSPVAAAAGAAAVPPVEDDALYDEYMEMKNNRDHVFGMYKKDEDTYWLGTKQVIIDNDENITIDGYNYGNARGLWNFLMLNDPKLFTRTEKDENDYLSIVETTDLFNNPTNDPSGNTAKFKWLKQHMVKEQDEQEPGGSGIGNDGYISKLIQRLHLVVAERYAGNVEATTPVILQILKELKRVKYLDDIDIANTCKELCIPFGNPGTEAI